MSVKCRNCNFELIEVVDFGKMPISNAFLDRSDFSNEYFYNMSATVCKNCYLFQLLEQPDPKMLFHENYAFFAGTSNSMQKHFSELSDELFNKYQLKVEGILSENL